MSLLVLCVTLVFLVLVPGAPVHAKPWRFVEATQRGDAITVVLEDAGDTATPKRRQTVVYYLEGSPLTGNTVRDIKDGIRARVRAFNDAETVVDVSTILDPGP